MIVERDISQLSVGMYIVDISFPKDRFRLSSQGWVEDERIINALKAKGVERLLIDTAKSRLVGKSVTRPEKRQSPPPNSRFFSSELVKAKQVFEESKSIQQKIFHDAKNGVPLNLAPVKAVTEQSIDLIFDNPDALACVLNIRHKDQYLLEHSVAVSVLMSIFAFYLKIDKEIVHHLAIGAFLHDVGKIMIPEHILNKPGKLTDDEFAIMKTHATHSIRTIKNTPNISSLSLEVARLHHEKLNGKGYPNGLPEREISTYGRMIAICDIFDALTSTRCYKSGYPQVKAFSILRVLAKNNELDVQLVDHFIKCMGVYPVGSVVQLESNRLAIVERHNTEDPIRPTVRPFYVLNPDHFEACHHIDLATAADDLIVKCVRADDFNLNMDEIIEFLSHQG
ncbi:HD-GYP domain-containing protein [Shewanella colwelliana]|uniref:Phosphodiesterase n=1 Tax=Shewanella colwelliana TaxID=23 RepID=A0A1E5INS1_SHECO|nr:HD-GYP domain-containing protein [Shewanella colwelliana]MDX1280325.1 HD-GYP domain-containing protein [Shewanella colwelliana]OEG72126.1 phosphohydrolase [Shewanella colwelliana]GIU39507.1 phosphodiesterase [Shewanella colwelliana]